MTQKTQEIIATRQVCSWCFATLDYILRFLQKKYETYERNDEFYCAVQEGLQCSELPTPPLCIQEWISQKVEVPLFVTWMLREQSQDSVQELRGCIGTLEPVPIENLAKYCCEAAFNDTRFSPITLKELPLLECHVSFLFCFEPCRRLQDWDIDIHGIRVTFQSSPGEARSKIYQSTFLPGVAKTHHMTHISTIENLIRKAGWKKAIDQTLLQSLYVERYQSSEAKLTYIEYITEFVKNI